MTFSADELVALLDKAMTSGEWHSVRIFNGAAVGSSGIMVSMGRDHSCFTVDQLIPEAKPSEKLFWLLRDNLRRVRAAAPETTPSDPLSNLLDDI
ncbi:hypothetical protein [Rhizobium nepotum]|uniref:hypothetical protein n=1 Tax=Rhizobium nepotum TaxID=1035271 RepID=UPI003CEC000E